MGNADVLVVGGGMAGLAVAAELGRRRRRSVAVLEAGPDRARQHIRATHPPAEAHRLWLRPETDPDFWRPYHSADGSYLDLAGLRRRVGGRSLYWGGVLLPIEPWALADGWPDEIVHELTCQWDGGVGLYKRVAEDVERWGAEPVRGFELEVGDRSFERTPVATRRESAGAWSTFSPLAWWDGEHGDPEVRAVPILAGHYVMGVLVERGRAVGARVRTAAGEVHDLRATRVVLAAGTMENSRLAMQAMAAADGGAPRELTGLVDKVAQGFMVAFEDVKCLPESIRAAARGGQLYHRVGTEQTRSNHFVRFGETATGAVTLDSWTMGEQWRGLNGRVTCENADAWPWPTVVRAGLGPGDRALRLDQQNTLRQFWAAVAERFGGRGFPLRFADRHGSSDLRERLTNDHPAPLTYSFPLGSEQHEAGTLPLGGFVDESDQQLKAVPGLYACGPAVFPRTGAANPSMTTLALSRRLGAILAG